MAVSGCLWVGGCNSSPMERAAPPLEFEGGDLVSVALNQQATVRNFLRIGLGFISREKNGLTAGLWIYVRGDSSKDQVATVHIGQSLNVAGYSFFVEGIQGGKRGSVLLRILPPDARGKS